MQETPLDFLSGVVWLTGEMFVRIPEYFWAFVDTIVAIVQ
jgi:hypothetical protein